ncbi:hypothetical protein EYF80_041822 [Liparis tanakae]|uniref:Uncharacterized protein n=1 Tax=Liparis tanakae TaxID=230148 RepID=A0A4Z2G3A8_9TELE|nr:hypothetical protein EYF80_041822 [Liparis tanakae]
MLVGQTRNLFCHSQNVHCEEGRISIVSVKMQMTGVSYHGFDGRSANSGVLVPEVVADDSLDVPHSSWIAEILITPSTLSTSTGLRAKCSRYCRASVELVALQSLMPVADALACLGPSLHVKNPTMSTMTGRATQSAMRLMGSWTGPSMEDEGGFWASKTLVIKLHGEYLNGNRTDKWRPGVVAKHRAVLSRPGEVELGGVSHAEQSVVVGEEDATQGQASSGLQLGDGGGRRDAEDRDVDGSDGLSALHADVGARVVHDKVAQRERAVGEKPPSHHHQLKAADGVIIETQVLLGPQHADHDGGVAGGDGLGSGDTNQHLGRRCGTLERNCCLPTSSPNSWGVSSKRLISGWML